MTWPPPLLLSYPHQAWSLDATAAGVDPEALAALPWASALQEQEALEAGAIANPDEQRRVGHFWLRDATLAPTLELAGEIDAAVEQVRDLARGVRDGVHRTDAGEAFTDVVHLGIGGSALGPRLIVHALGTDAHGRRRGLPVHFVDNVDPDGLTCLLGLLGERLATTLVVVASKSGGTAEPLRGLARLRQAFEDRGLRPAARLVAITTPGSRLDRQARQEQWLASLPVWDWVGGRFSVTSTVGLLPCELAGVDTAGVLEGAAAMDHWTRRTDPLANPAAVLAGAWYLLGEGRGARDLVVLPYADRLDLLGRHLQQLVMESVGKRLDRQGQPVHHGLTVYGNKGSTDQHAFVQQLRDGRDDALVTFVQVLSPSPADPELGDGVSAGDQLQGFLLGTRRALRQDGRPSLTLTAATLDGRALGSLIALFERAVGLYASLVDVNAYDQPGVEAGKVAATRILALAEALRTRLRAAPATVPALAEALEADPVEVLFLLQRAAVRGAVAADGPDPLLARWRLP
ncbi:MAG: glucose-6-phosphate isomerase [Alphaproteobacteria bacterium]|nr:glucose-6-phosphate isomerase [Alphaproteobacteria bacterium]